MTHNYVIVVPTKIKAEANAIGEALFGAVGVFDAGLVPAEGPDNADPTHYWACGMCEDESREQLELLAPSFPGGVLMFYDYNTNRNFPSDYIDGVNLKPYSPG